MSTVLLAAAAATLWLLLATPASRSARRLPDTSPVGRAATRTRRSADQAALVGLVERTSRDVRSGVTLRSALVDALGQHPDALPGLHGPLSRGAVLGDALNGLGEISSRDARFVVHGLRLAADTGGAMADTLDRVVAVVRERQAWRAERSAQSAQARLSARMLTVLPMAVATWGLVSGPRVRDAYSDTPVTAGLAGIGVLLNLLGWWWMRRLVRGPRLT